MAKRIILAGLVATALVCLMGMCALQAMKQEDPKRQKEEQLLGACMLGELDTVKELVQEGVDLNVRDNFGCTPLMWAVANGDAEIVKYLLQNKVNIDAKNNYRKTALSLAIEDNKIEIVKLLLNAGASVERAADSMRIFHFGKPEIKSLVFKRINEIYAPMRRNYRNLIIIINDGSEWLSKDKGLGMLADFGNALAEECAFILIPSEFWDYFLHAHYETIDAVTKQPITIDTKKLFDQIKDRWEVYKIPTLVKAEKPKEAGAPQEEDSLEVFYVFCPIDYKKLFIPDQKNQKKTTDQETLSTQLKGRGIQLGDIKNDCLDLGLNLLKKEKIEPDKLTQQSELGKLFEENEVYQDMTIEKIKLQQDMIDEKLKLMSEGKIELTAAEWGTMKSQFHEISERLTKKSTLLDYIAKRKRSINKNFIECLNKLLVFPQVKKLNSDIELPQYNVYISGHGGSTEPSPEFEALMARWSSKGYVAPSEIVQLQDKVSQQLMEKGDIAGLPANVFGKALECFNGVTNSLFVHTCHGGGLHLTLPFVFMTSPPSLSYTLINHALIDAPTSGASLWITLGAEKYKFEAIILFQNYFDGISNFPHFAKNKAETPNSFSQLLNYVGSFLDLDGKKIKRIENIPWIKLPGPTNWQVVSYVDNQVLVINDAMMTAKKLEKDFKLSGEKFDIWEKSPRFDLWEKSAREEIAALTKDISGLKSKKTKTAQEQSDLRKKENTFKQLKDLLEDFEKTQKKSMSAITAPQKMTPAEQKAWKEKWGKWEEERKAPAKSEEEKEPDKSSEFIDASQKKFIFVATNNVSLEVRFGKTTETKAIIPIMPTTGFANIMTFEKKVRSDDTFAHFFDKVLRPKEPLFKMPERTVIFIKELLCADVNYKNFILPFDIPELMYDFCYSADGTTYGIKIGAVPEKTKVSLDDILSRAIDDNKVWLADTLLKVGANPNYSKVELYGATLLSFAIAKNKIEIIKLLINAKADLNKKSIGGFTALYEAAANGSIDIVRVLLKAGADVMVLPRPDALDKIKSPEMLKLLTDAMRQSPKFKKELQMLQQKVAADVWKGDKSVDKIIPRHLSAFRAGLSIAN